MDCRCGCHETSACSHCRCSSLQHRCCRPCPVHMRTRGVCALNSEITCASACEFVFVFVQRQVSGFFLKTMVTAKQVNFLSKGSTLQSISVSNLASCLSYIEPSSPEYTYCWRTNRGASAQPHHLQGPQSTLGRDKRTYRCKVKFGSNIAYESRKLFTSA